MALEGCGKLYLHDRFEVIGAGSSYLFYPNEKIIVSQESHHPVKHFLAFLNFPHRPFPENMRPGLAMMNDLVGVTVLARKLVETILSQDATSRRQAHILAETLLLEYRKMIDLKTSHGSAHDGKLLELANRIRLEPELPWSVAACAREMGLCRSQFSRLFKQLTANSPIRFIVKCRMQKAGRLLRETHLSVNEIADMMGYRDVFYFSKHFRQENGQAPSHYRRENPAFSSEAMPILPARGRRAESCDNARETGG